MGSAKAAAEARLRPEGRRGGRLPAAPDRPDQDGRAEAGGYQRRERGEEAALRGDTQTGERYAQLREARDRSATNCQGMCALYARRVSSNSGGFF